MTNFTPAQWRLLDGPDTKTIIGHNIRDAQVQGAIATKGPVFQQIYFDGQLDAAVQTPFPGLYTEDEYQQGHGLGSLMMDTGARAQFAQYQFDKQLVAEADSFGSAEGRIWKNVVPLFIDFYVKDQRLRFLGMMVDTAFYECTSDFILTPNDNMYHVHLYNENGTRGEKAKINHTFYVSRGDVFLVRRSTGLGHLKTFDIFSKKHVDAYNRVTFGIFNDQYPTPLYNSNKSEFNNTLDAGMEGTDFEGAYNVLKSKSHSKKHKGAKKTLTKLSVPARPLTAALPPNPQPAASGGSGQPAAESGNQ